MKYIWCNIKNFFINKKLIFLLTVFSIICSCVMIHFSYGLFQNYQLKKQYDLSNKREIVLTLQDNYEEVPDNELNDDEFYLRVPEKLDAYVTVDLLKKFVAEFGNSFEEKLKYIEMTAVVDELPFRLMFTIKDGVITKSDEFEKEVEDNAMLESGRYFTEEEYQTGQKVAICWDYLHWNTRSSPVSNRMAIDKETLRIQGKDYKICVVLTVPAYLVGIFLFENILLKQISGHYEYMSDSYNAFLYLVLFVVYFLVSLLILSLMIVHALKSDAELDVRGGFQ